MNIEIRTLRGRSLAEHRDRTDWTRHRIRSLTFADHRANSPAKTNSNCLAERVALIGINSGQGVSKSTYWAGEDDADGRVVVAQSSWAARSLDFVLSHYVKVGVDELDQEKLTPLLRLKYKDSIADALADLGRPEEIGKIFAGFQKFLYQQAA